MTRRRYRRLGTAAAGGASLIALIAAGGGGEAAVGRPFTLSITGAEGARYTGRCTVTTAAGEEETLELSGVVPRHEEIAAVALACRIESEDPITVEVVRDGSRSRSATSGGVVNISVR